MGRDGCRRPPPVRRRRAARSDAALRSGAGAGAGEARADPGPLRGAHRPARRNHPARPRRAGARRRASRLARDPVRPGGHRPRRQPRPGRRALCPFGATSQDVLDTALVLCTRTAVTQLEQELHRASRAATSLARRHAGTPALARTLLQPAAVTTIGFRCAQWAQALARSRAAPARQRRRRARRLARAGQSAIWRRGETPGARLRAELASTLGLSDPGATWHTQRDAWIGLAADAALATGAMAKIARDIALMAQAEVGEAEEPAAPGRGGSTAMPHKHNPVLSMRVLAAAQPVPALVAGLLAAMPQEYERALGNWQAEAAQFPDVLSTPCPPRARWPSCSRACNSRARCRANIDALAGHDLLGEPGRLFAPAAGQAGGAGAGGHPVHTGDRHPDPFARVGPPAAHQRQSAGGGVGGRCGRGVRPGSGRPRLGPAGAADAGGAFRQLIR